VVWACIGKSKTGAQESIESDHHPAKLTPLHEVSVESLREAREFSLSSKAFTLVTRIKTPNSYTLSSECSSKKETGEKKRVQKRSIIQMQCGSLCPTSFSSLYPCKMKSDISCCSYWHTDIIIFPKECPYEDFFHSKSVITTGA